LQANLARLLLSFTNHKTRTSQETGNASEVTLDYTRNTEGVEIQEWLDLFDGMIEVARRERTRVSLLVASQTLAKPSLRKFISGHDDMSEP
jgi:hypothetical protein